MNNIKLEIEEAEEILNENVPDSVRLKWCLKQLGKQESYIQELEHELKATKIQNEPNSKDWKEIKKDDVYKQKLEIISQWKKRFRKLSNDYEYLLSKYNTLKQQTNESN